MHHWEFDLPRSEKWFSLFETPLFVTVLGSGCLFYWWIHMADDKYRQIHHILLKLAIHNSQFPKLFGSLWMSLCIFSKNCESLKSDTLWISRVIHWTSYIVSYFKPIKYPLLNNNVISQTLIYIIASFLVIILLRSSKL